MSVKIVEYRIRLNSEQKPFLALILQGGIEIVKSANGNVYATAKKASLATTFDEATCKSLIGTEMPGQIVREDCDPYQYTVEETGELEHAKARGAKIYGEVLGYGCSADANDIVAPCADGEGAGRAMVLALKKAGLKPEDIQYVNAHGTSTPLGDIAETIAIKRVFGDYAKNGLLVSSTKSMHGHLLGAAGSLEGIICILAINNKTAPPTTNLDHQDEQCDLDYVANTPRQAPTLTHAMSNSFGFGGHNASLIFGEYNPN